MRLRFHGKILLIVLLGSENNFFIQFKYKVFNNFKITLLAKFVDVSFFL